MKETIAALGVGVAIAAVMSCGGSGKKAPTSAMPSAHGDAGIPGGVDAKTRIQQLDDDINKAFAQLDAGARPVVTPPPDPTALTATAEMPVKWSDDPKCKPSEAQVCKDTCQLSDSICTSATKICEIAKDLAGDAWAAEKCSSGEASCKAAHDKCCGCS